MMRRASAASSPLATSTVTANRTSRSRTRAAFSFSASRSPRRGVPCGRPDWYSAFSGVRKGRPYSCIVLNFFPLGYRMRISSSFLLLFGFFSAILTLAHAVESTTPAFELKAGDRVALIGDTLIEREQAHGWIELMLTARFADRDI